MLLRISCVGAHTAMPPMELGCDLSLLRLRILQAWVAAAESQCVDAQTSLTQAISTHSGELGYFASKSFALSMHVYLPQASEP